MAQTIKQKLDMFMRLGACKCKKQEQEQMNGTEKDRYQENWT